MRPPFEGSANGPPSEANRLTVGVRSEYLIALNFGSVSATPQESSIFSMTAITFSTTRRQHCTPAQLIQEGGDDLWRERYLMASKSADSVTSVQCRLRVLQPGEGMRLRVQEILFTLSCSRRGLRWALGSDRVSVPRSARARPSSWRMKRSISSKASFGIERGGRYAKRLLARFHSCRKSFAPI
jgi:hypothetical protein